MELYGQQSKSIPQKIIIHVLEILLLWLSFWILFQNGDTWVESTLYIHNSTELNERRTIIFAFNIITFIRFSFMMIALLKRKIPWEESISVPFAFSLYFIGFSLFVLPTSKPIDSIDYLGILLFVIGSVLNSGGEILRNKWKKNPENKGEIYTGGFFKYSRHINYFGDLLWVIAYTIVTRNWYAISIPVFLFCFFAFYNAPKLDSYLKSKYGQDYDNYASKTKMLIPFIY
jgi:protein-S-isoprenylcysteine O-methyltransferase Ste14